MKDENFVSFSAVSIPIEFTKPISQIKWFIEKLRSFIRGTLSVKQSNKMGGKKITPIL